MASSVENEEEALCIQLPAPSGWKKKSVPKKGGILKKSEIIFISPTGEEIASKRELARYLKAHPGNPSYSEFEWGKTGETPRRSTRISEKVKASPLQETEPPKKRSRKSSASKEIEETKNETEKTENDKADLALDEGPVKENQTEKEEEGKETDTELKIEGVVSKSKDAEADTENKADLAVDEDLVKENQTEKEEGKETDTELKVEGVVSKSKDVETDTEPKVEGNKADLAVDEDLVKENQTEKGEEGKETDTEPKVEGDVSKSKDVETDTEPKVEGEVSKSKDDESLKLDTEYLDGSADREKAAVGKNHENEKTMAENGSNVSEGKQ